MKCRRPRHIVLALGLAALALAVAEPAYAQFSAPASSVTAGTSCTGAPANGATGFYLWPDPSGNILSCNGSTWQLGAISSVAAAGANGDVQFNNGGTFGGSANLFWNNASGYLGIGTNAPAASLSVSGGVVIGAQYAGVGSTAPMSGMIVQSNVGIGTWMPQAQLHLAGGVSSVAWGTGGIGIRQDNATYIDTTTSGTINNNYVNVIGTPTLVAVNTATYSNATTLYVAAPVAGSHVTFGTTSAIATNGNIVASGAFNAFGGTGPTAVLDVAGNNYSSGALSTTAGPLLKIEGPTITDLSGSGTIAARIANSIAAPTFASAAVETETNAVTLYIAGAPTAGTHVSITNPLALDVASGVSSFGGNVGIGTAAPQGALDVEGAANTLLNSGLVGIGTNYPYRALHVSGATASEMILEDRQANANFKKWDFVVDGASGSNSEFYIRQLNDAGSGGTTDFYIGGTGNVGVGTNAPGSALAVSGGTSIGTTYTGTAAPTNGAIIQGNVGVGTTSPNFMLDVGSGVLTNVVGGNSIAVTSGNSSSAFRLGQGNANQGRLVWNYNSIAANAYLALGANGSNSLVLQDVGGNVGIGTTAPQYQVDITNNQNAATELSVTNVGTGSSTLAGVLVNAVSGGAGDTGAVFVVPSTYTGQYNAYGTTSFTLEANANIQNLSLSAVNSSSGKIAFFTGGRSASDERMRIDVNGNLGIGTTAPNVKLSLGVANGQPINIAPYDGGGTNVYGMGVITGALSFGAGISPSTGTPQMVLTNTGEVGIGSTAPTVALDVNGALYGHSVSIATTTVNWTQGNVQGTSQSCGAFSFSGMMDGGSYTLTVEGTTAGTCSFSNTDAPTLTFKMPSNFGASTSGTMTLFHFTRRGTNVFVTWMPGY